MTPIMVQMVQRIQNFLKLSIMVYNCPIWSKIVLNWSKWLNIVLKKLKMSEQDKISPQRSNMVQMVQNRLKLVQNSPK